MGFSWFFLIFIIMALCWGFQLFILQKDYFEKLSEIITVILLYFQLQIIYDKTLNNTPDNIYDEDYCK